MSFNLIPKNEIEKSRLNEQIVYETAQQVIKDFANFGMEISFPEDLNYAYDELYEQLKIIIFDLMQKNPGKLSALLYQIDVDERKMKQNAPDMFEEHEWITDLILEREFFKVLTRHYFRNH